MLWLQCLLECNTWLSFVLSISVFLISWPRYLWCLYYRLSSQIPTDFPILFVLIKLSSNLGLSKLGWVCDVDKLLFYRMHTWLPPTAQFLMKPKTNSFTVVSLDICPYKSSILVFFLGKFDQNSCHELFTGFWSSLGGSTCSQGEELEKSIIGSFLLECSLSQQLL